MKYDFEVSALIDPVSIKCVFIDFIATNNIF